IWSLDYERIYTSLDTSFLGSYSITRCYADQNRVYMGTQLYNLVIFDVTEDRFENFILSDESTNYWETTVIEGNDSHVAVGTKDGIITIEKSSLNASYYQFGIGYNDNYINAIAFNGSTAYIGTQNNLYSLDVPTGSYQEVAIDYQMNDASYKRILSVLIDNNGLLIVTTENYIYSYDGTNTEFEVGYDIQSIVQVSSENKYYGMSQDSNYLIIIDPINDDSDPEDDVDFMEITFARTLTSSTYQPPPEYINTGVIPFVFLAIGTASLVYVFVQIKRH
ncbi:MAG: hypothetical protein ACTSP4_14965, partial [Candidatus Hodarchaeales archaeon]